MSQLDHEVVAEDGRDTITTTTTQVGKRF